MRISRLFAAIFTVTVFSVLYVYQQSEIFRLAYEGEKKQTAFQELLDKNNILRYNIEKSASLTKIGSRVSHDEEFQMPDTCYFVKMGYPSSDPDKLQQEQPRESLASRIFSIKRQAEAHTIER